MVVCAPGGEEIFRVERDGRIVSRGAVIGTDRELADTLIDIGEVMRAVRDQSRILLPPG
jgi:hypothetical protein